MKLLEKSLKIGGFQLDQILREKNIAIYKRVKGMYAGYEVIVIRPYHEGESSFGVKFESGESYPSSSRWGIDGFTYSDYPSALAKFRKLLRQKSI